jgi:hypothetical protein
VVAAAIPGQHDFAEPGAGRDQGHVGLVRLAGLKPRQRRRPETQHPVRGGLQVVHQLHARRPGALRERGLVDHPRQIDRGASAVDDGSGDPDAGRVDRDGRALQEKLSDRLLGRRVAVARGHGFADERLPATPLVEEGQRSLGPADVAGEDHPAVCST